MSFNLIDPKMLVRNSISVTPIETYSSASLECNSLNSLGLENPGVFGKVKSKNICNLDYTLSGDITLKRNYLVGVEGLNTASNEKSIDVLNVIKEDNDLDDRNKILSALENKGLYLDNSGEFYFQVEKVKEKYLLDDNNFYKKKSIKNLYRFYRENIHHRIINPRWGFSNYNCINFFNNNSVVFPNITHKNYLAYPSKLLNGVENYKIFSEFNDINTSKNESATFSFYINQNKKNKNGHHFNPGCVLSIPGVIGIYVVKGTSLDENNKTNSFRIFIDGGENTLNFANNTSFINNNIDSNQSIFESTGDGLFRFLSSDNIIDYNCWKNVSIVLSKSKVSLKEDSSGDNEISVNVKLYIDSEIIDNETLTIVFDDTAYSLRYLSQKFDNTIFIGNRPHEIANKIESSLSKKGVPTEDLFKKLFSYNNENEADLSGPFVNKFISFGEEFDNSSDENEESVSTQGFTVSLNKNLKSKSDDDNLYINNDTSLALTCEIHDIRIYSDEIVDIKNKICLNSIKDFSESTLVFSLPVVYFDKIIAKKAIVNINGLDEDSIAFDSDTGIFSTVKISEATKSNLIFEGVSNPYFSNKCNGHEVIVEKFLREFKKGSFPNIVFNSDTLSDSGLYDSFNLLTTEIDSIKSFSNKDSILNKNVNLGESLNHTFNKYIYQVDNENFDLNNNDPTDLARLESFLSGNMNYKNNLILPCDNGLQKQNLNNFSIDSFYDQDYAGFIHNDENNTRDITHVSVLNNFSDLIVHKPVSSYASYAKNSELFENSSISRQLFPEAGRRKYFFTSLPDRFFRESYDLLYNASLNNFYSDFTLSGGFNKLTGMNRLPSETVVLTADSNSFLRNLSNPASRIIIDDYSNSINNVSSLIFKKDLSSNEFIGYFNFELPVFNINKDYSERYCNILCISNQIYNKRLEREETSITDYDLGGSRGSLSITLKDNNKGMLYRSNCLTKVADWNYVGNCLYNEGIITILHPSLDNFTENNYELKFRSNSTLNVFELNLPSKSGKSNYSNNLSYDDDLRASSSSFDADEPFVYITDINLHDENLNIVGKAKLTKPFAKKNSDNVLFRLKMDF